MKKQKKDFLTTAEAAARASVTKQTIRNWCDRHAELGEWVHGRLRVHPVALEKILTEGGREKKK